MRSHSKFPTRIRSRANDVASTDANSAKAVLSHEQQCNAM
jgi:hypothetical protein